MSHAQSVLLEGKVLQDNVPIANVEVINKQLNNVSLTNVLGEFEIPIERENNLAFFKNGYSYYFPCQKKPDVKLTNQAAKYLLEVNDFACFSKSHAGAKTTICKVTKAEWEVLDDHSIVFHITADRFLRNMVRAIVGTLIDIGNGKLTSEDLKKIIESKNRSMAGTSVPGNGLYLCEIKYPYL